MTLREPNQFLIQNEVYNKDNLSRRTSLFGVYPSTENLNKKGVTNRFS